MKRINVNEFKKKYSSRKNPINNSIIKTFYESPQSFFEKFKISLKNSSYFDISGNSIFMHYFYVLYEDHKKNKKKLSKNNLITEKILLNINIYRNNFNQFFKEHKEKLIIQDFSLDTVLHKIAKLNDKTFFVKICQKLQSLKLLNKRIMTIKNIENKACYDYLFEEINYKYNYYINRESMDCEALKNFVIMIKKEYSDCIFDLLPFDTKKLLNNFILKNTFEIIQKSSFTNIYYNIEKLFKIETDLNIIKYIFFPFASGINYLNILFNASKSSEDYITLYNFIIKILNIMGNIENNNSENLKTDLFLSEFCIMDHINHTLAKIYSSKINVKLEFEYCTALIKTILKRIIQKKDDKFIIDILKYRKEYYKKQLMQKQAPEKRLGLKMQNGLIFNLISNNYLDFEKKKRNFNNTK